MFIRDCALPSDRLKIFSNLHEPLPQQKVIEQMKVLILTLSLWYALEQNSKTLFVCLAECCDLKLFWFWNNTKTNRQKRKFSIKYLQEKYKALKAKAMRGNICIYRGGNPQAVSYPE